MVVRFWDSEEVPSKPKTETQQQQQQKQEPSPAPPTSTTTTTTRSITCGICRQQFGTGDACYEHMKTHSLARAIGTTTNTTNTTTNTTTTKTTTNTRSSARPKSSIVMTTTSPVPHFSPPGSPLPKRPQTALATAFRKSPTPLKSSSTSLSLLKRAMSEPPGPESGKKGGKLVSPFVGQQGDVLAWQPELPPRPKKGFVCYYCQREFPDALSLTRHSRNHGSAAPYSCSRCGKMFPLYSSLMTHEKSHGVERSPAAFRCRTCGSLFLHQASLKAHERRHHDEEPGGVGGVGFSSAGGPETRPYQCATCGERVSNEALLRIHKQRHEGFRTPRVCTLCGTTFSCDAFLRAHARVHEGEPTLRCVICVRPFRRSRVLLRHSDVHAEERRNVCGDCQRRFPKVAEDGGSSWRRRMRWLEEDEGRQFTCLYCGVGFSRLHQLAAHEASHRELPMSSSRATTRKPQLHLPTVIVN